MTYDAEYPSLSGTEDAEDMFFFSPNSKGGMLNNQNPHFMLFSNQEHVTRNMAADM